MLRKFCDKQITSSQWDSISFIILYTMRRYASLASIQARSVANPPLRAKVFRALRELFIRSLKVSSLRERLPPAMLWSILGPWRQLVFVRRSRASIRRDWYSSTTSLLISRVWAPIVTRSCFWKPGSSTEVWPRRSSLSSAFSLSSSSSTFKSNLS